MQENWASRRICCHRMKYDGSRFLDPRNDTTFSALSTLPQVQYTYNTFLICRFVDYLSISLWWISLQCKWMRLNKHDRIWQCSRKFAMWKSLRLRNKNNSWCRIGKWHCLKTRRFKNPTCHFRHPRRIFVENFVSHRKVRRSAAWWCERRAHRDRKLFLRANLHKFQISNCRRDWDSDLGLCTFWVLAKREPLSKSARV